MTKLYSNQNECLSFFQAIKQYPKRIRRYRMKKKLLKPDRVRKINGSFAFIPHRFLRDGFFDSLTHNELLLYFFLILVSDRNGISWYSYDSICVNFRWILEEYIEARNNLINKDLIAFDGYVFQVLDLPKKPFIQKKQILSTEKDMETYDPATIRNMISKSLGVDHND
jgi:hypothetical protein